MGTIDTATANHIHVLKKEIEYLKSTIDPNRGGQGTTKTTIRILEGRVKDLENK
ncbi:MAG: hypothetical protein VW496_03420 [Pelagibacteraceae bacterium]